MNTVLELISLFTSYTIIHSQVPHRSNIRIRDIRYRGAVQNGFTVNSNNLIVFKSGQWNSHSGTVAHTKPYTYVSQYAYRCSVTSYIHRSNRTIFAGRCITVIGSCGKISRQPKHCNNCSFINIFSKYYPACCFKCHSLPVSLYYPAIHSRSSTRAMPNICCTNFINSVSPKANFPESFLISWVILFGGDSYFPKRLLFLSLSLISGSMIRFYISPANEGISDTLTLSHIKYIKPM